jgi:hypothetical protein
MMNFKFFLLAFVTMFAESAWAGWTFVTNSDETSQYQYFLDFETLRIEGNERRIWQLVNHSSTNKYGWSSMRSRNLYECKNDTVQILTMQTFAEPFANGKEVGIESRSPGSKSDVPPNTVGWKILKEVCKR